MIGPGNGGVRTTALPRPAAARAPCTSVLYSDLEKGGKSKLSSPEMGSGSLHYVLSYSAAAKKTLRK